MTRWPTEVFKRLNPSALLIPPLLLEKFRELTAVHEAQTVEILDIDALQEEPQEMQREVAERDELRRMLLKGYTMLKQAYI